MTEHLTSAQLSALADGELAGDQLQSVKAHIDECLVCAKSAVDEWLLKGAAAKAGRRYDAPANLSERMAALVSKHPSTETHAPGALPAAPRSPRKWSAIAGWAVAAVLLLVLGNWSIMRFRTRGAQDLERAALVTEACDLHIALLAANQPPQVISSDRHTVKPWFQGKLPFSFNLPEALPAGVTLDGANLAYLHNRPVAQLLFSIGRHRVSVFVEEKQGTSLHDLSTAHDGFNIAGFETGDLEVIAVSDVDPARLAELVNALQASQAHR
jgi:anti-sigma factor RsiW